MLGLAACAPHGPREGHRAADAASVWLRDIANGDADAAWNRLDAQAKTLAFEDDPQRFRDGVAGATGSDWRWTISTAPVWRDIEWIVHVEVPSGQTSVPRFLVDRGVVEPWNVDGQFRGILLHVKPDDRGGLAIGARGQRAP